MDYRRQGQCYCSPKLRAALSGFGKKKDATLLESWEELWRAVADKASTTLGCRQRYREHLLAQLVCPGRHTITSLISLNANQHRDWTADYHLYSHQRVHPEAILDQVRREVEHFLPDSQTLCVALDDTLLRKTGKKIPGTAYRRDPLGPPFQVNLVWAQRMIQFSAAVPSAEGDARMIPIGWTDASTPRKPRKNAPDEAHIHYKEQMKQRNLSALALQELHALQRRRAQGQSRCPDLRVVVDGSYTNKTVMRGLPEHTVLIGRIRKDARLFDRPTAQSGAGRKRFYGDRLPTPDEIRTDETIPWQEVKACVHGKQQRFQVKTLSPVRWKGAGDQDLRLVVIAPVKYHVTSKGKHMYRRPAFLICTDPDLPLEELLQNYLWRWDIEVNHRDEKTLLGVGQAQVRHPDSVHRVPASAVAAYAMLHVAAMKAYGWTGKAGALPEAKWRQSKKKRRASTQDLIKELRRELWASAIRKEHLSHFVSPSPSKTNGVKLSPNLAGALFAVNA